MTTTRISRRGLLAALPAIPALRAFAEPRPAKIAAIEIWQYQGHRQTRRGVDQQYQVNPLHIYDELRPAPYRDNPNPTIADTAESALYLHIKTDEGLVGLHGPVDTEVAMVIDTQL